LSGDTTDPYISTIHRIVVVLGGSLDDVFAESKVVVGNESIVELKETVDVIEASQNLLTIENEMLKTKVNALTTELELLKKELAHKEELLALHNYYKIHIEQLTKKEGM
jgi:hypothetical protein